MIAQTVKNITTSKASSFGLLLALSWFYAACSQVMIPLPFNLVPVSIQPLPLLLAAHFFGWRAVSSYALYLFQGVLGLPFFAGYLSGIGRLLGPTGGYLFGFGLAMSFLVLTQSLRSRADCFIRSLSAGVIYFSAGLLQLSLFVPASKLLAAGLYPFFVGDGLKLVILSCVLAFGFVTRIARA